MSAEKSKDFPDAFYRVTIKGLCVRDGKVLMVKEGHEWSNKWELPGGGLDFGEDIQTAFAREVQEEMGLTVTKMSEKPVYVWPFKYVGKRNMEWYYSFVVAYRVEFEHLNITPTGECEEIQFFSKEELASVETNGQMIHLKDIFDPKDFEGPF
jgi:8-oxo-dGTP pyrophosphatase MutT (NUDIX family)